MTEDEILRVPSMPASAPSYPRGPYRFMRRGYLIVNYETDPHALRAALPEPLEPAPGNIAYYEGMKMPDASGFGDYEESGSGIQAVYRDSRATSPSRCTSTMSPPGIPVRRPHPSAMCTAAVSCLT
jgi:acetoacetate decarboxylase